MTSFERDPFILSSAGIFRHDGPQRRIEARPQRGVVGGHGRFRGVRSSARSAQRRCASAKRVANHGLDPSRGMLKKKDAPSAKKISCCHGLASSMLPLRHNSRQAGGCNIAAAVDGDFPPKNSLVRTRVQGRRYSPSHLDVVGIGRPISCTYPAGTCTSSSETRSYF